MSLWDGSRKYLMTREQVIDSLIPERCGGCAVANTVAQELVTEAQSGDLALSELGLQYDLRIGSKCSLGLIELSEEVKFCLQDPNNVLPEVPELPKLTALE